MKNRKVKHYWEYLPYFQIVDGMVIAVQVCKKTGACRYIRVPSDKKLRRMEEEE